MNITVRVPVITDFRLSWCYTVDVGLVLKSLHCVSSGLVQRPKSKIGNSESGVTLVRELLQRPSCRA
jgi:hypothetical protein